MTAAGMLAAALLLAGCGQTPKPGGPTTSSAVPRAHTEGLSIELAVPGTLAGDFAVLQQGFGGKSGMTMMAVGGQSQLSFGDWTTGPAWSTMKIPLAVAALRNNSAYNAIASTAIIASDNGAADTLWQSLGTAVQAAAAVEGVLREGGDTRTTVPTTRARADASIFGQADWSLTDQARFASELPCLPQTERVIGLMGQIQPSHRWGLGALASAEFKGGWGPDPAGKYLVRQFGLIDTPSGRVAVAFAAQPDSGLFNDGMVQLDKMTKLLSAHLADLVGGQCPA